MTPTVHNYYLISLAVLFLFTFILHIKLFIVMLTVISTESLTVISPTHVEVREGDDSITFCHLSGSNSKKITVFYQRGGHLSHHRPTAERDI